MDNLSEKLNSLLSDPGAMAQIQAMASSLGLGGSPEQAPPQKGPSEQNSLAALGPVLALGRQEDDSTRLLTALRPLLSHEKQDKLDKALKMLRLMRMIPLLKDSGILGSLM